MAAKHIRACQVTGASTAYVQLLRISGTGGELKSLAVSDGIAYHKFRVTIDGIKMVDAYLAATSDGSFRSNTGLTVGLRFEQSLKVDVKASELSPQTTYWAVACTDSSELTGRHTFVEDVGDAPYRFEQLSYRGDDEHDYEVTAAIGPEKVSRIIVDDESYDGDEWITGLVDLRSAAGEPLSEGTVPFVMRRSGSRRNRPIRGPEGDPYALRDVHGEKRFELPVTLLLDQLAAPHDRYLLNRGYPPLPYPALFGPGIEIAADLHGYSNYPAHVELW